MTEPRDFTRERRLRRIAARRGYVLDRCRRRDPLAIDHGLWRLAPAGRVPTETVGPTFTLTLDQVEAALDNPARDRADDDDDDRVAAA